MKKPGYDMRPCSLKEVRALCERHHQYGGAGCSFTYAFGVYEEGEVVAVYAWQPPAPGAARSVCPEAPQGVLALSRMAAVPREERRLNHVSRPLRRQMRVEIDRGRWPVLITYHDESVGHTGHVYKCSGWRPTIRRKRLVYVHPETGVRTSNYCCGDTGYKTLKRSGYAWFQRWEHWACERGNAWEHMQAHGWERVRIRGRTWRSGNPAYTYVKGG